MAREVQATGAADHAEGLAAVKRCARTGCPERFEAATTGRPRRFCSDACKQAAHRQRTRKLRGSLEVMSSSRTDDWPTDPKVYAELYAEFAFTLDPCSSHENHKAERYFTAEDDGLRQEWAGRVFMNPPYGRTLGAWMRKAWEASQTTAVLVVCLVPARTDTRWWHEYATRGEVRFVRGRLRFGDCPEPAPFPSAIVVFRNAQSVTEGPVESGTERVLRVAA